MEEEEYNIRLERYHYGYEFLDRHYHALIGWAVLEYFGKNFRVSSAVEVIRSIVQRPFGLYPSEYRGSVLVQSFLEHKSLVDHWIYLLRLSNLSMSKSTMSGPENLSISSRSFARGKIFYPSSRWPVSETAIRLHVEIELCGFNLDLPVAEW